MKFTLVFLWVYVLKCNVKTLFCIYLQMHFGKIKWVFSILLLELLLTNHFFIHVLFIFHIRIP